LNGWTHQKPRGEGRVQVKGKVVFKTKKKAHWYVSFRKTVHSNGAPFALWDPIAKIIMKTARKNQKSVESGGELGGGKKHNHTWAVEETGQTKGQKKERKVGTSSRAPKKLWGRTQKSKNFRGKHAAGNTRSRSAADHRGDCKRYNGAGSPKRKGRGGQGEDKTGDKHALNPSPKAD